MKREYKLPLNYNYLNWIQRKEVRELYIKKQNNICIYCKCDLYKPVPEWVKAKKINWELFPKHFLKYPIHLQHNHNTGMTEGAVHSYCNAVLWQYEGR